jgi:hypothetical protein
LIDNQLFTDIIVTELGKKVTELGKKVTELGLMVTELGVNRN